MSFGKKLQHVKIPLISIVDDDRSAVDAIFSLTPMTGALRRAQSYQPE
jgi:hypothetical protein